MKTLNHMAADRLAELVARFGQLRIAVVGDFFLDKYFDVDPALAEVSLETGKTAHQVVGVRHSPGAAGTVVCNLAALGAGHVFAAGFTGDDGQGYELRAGLAGLGCDIEHLHRTADRLTPTYLKPRDVTDRSLAGEHSRYDIKNRNPTPAALQQQVIASVERLLEQGIDALIVADQVEEDDCGVITSAVRRRFESLAQQWPAVVFWADSRRRIRRFRKVIIKPNQFEAVGWENPPPGAAVEPDRLAKALVAIRAQTGNAVVVTCGARGAMVSDPEPTLVPAVRVAGPIDPTGAGDSATAGAVLALAAGATLPEAALVGNLVASITIEQLATTGTARPDQLPERLQLWCRQQREP